MKNIRNFCILAHIDHGKSTLADRFLELTGTVEKRRMREQYLDMNPLEREKGITIKMQPVRMLYTLNAKPYTLNLIDTPGHVDFTYEVSRALAAVEGAILLVDATQGIQAQTLANFHLAEEEGLAIIPIINKIDLPSANIPEVEKEISQLLKVEPKDILKVSAKTGEGVEKLLRAVVDQIPPPSLAVASYGGQGPPKDREGEQQREQPLRALIFDSLYDSYQGVIVYLKVEEGTLATGEKLLFVANGAVGEAKEVGIFSPERVPTDKLRAGEIGYAATGIKEPEKVRVGDTVTLKGKEFRTKNLELRTDDSTVEPLPGYREPEPMVFASVFPENQDEYETLRDSLEKLKLNDASLSFEPEEGSGSALGRGFRAGFLGMLHMEIVSERLRREYGLALVFSNPSVAFRIETRIGADQNTDRRVYKVLYSAAKMPPQHEIGAIEERWAAVEIIAPLKFLGALNELIHERSGIIIETLTLFGERLMVKFEAPFREIIIDFYDRLKSVSRGFASMSYEVGGWRKADLVFMQILVAGEKVGALAEVVPREKAYHTARERVAKLKELLPRQLFSIALQAEVEGRIVARETIPALRKDVTGYLYGGDRTRKMKLWKKQQKGKKKLKEQSRVEIPAEVFLKMLKK